MGVRPFWVKTTRPEPRPSRRSGRPRFSRQPGQALARQPVAYWAAKAALSKPGTSIDALAVGASLAFVKVNILFAAGLIGLATTIMVTLGVMLGRVLGTLCGHRAEILGGLTLIGVGTWILSSHPRELFMPAPLVLTFVALPTSLKSAIFRGWITTFGVLR